MYDDIDPRNLANGTVVDGYTIVGKLGGGGMGEIYRAVRGQEVFALKLQGERLTEAMDPVKREELEARSRREAAVLLSLNHPNILAIVGSGRWPDRGGYLYLITEFVAGEPLDSWHARQQPSLRQLTHVFERVADALDYMHRSGIFHRDLKDPNVLVKVDATPVVIDLGIARSAAAYTLTRVGAVIGTTTHLSPGVCRYLVGEKSRAYRFGPHDDLHALGFMLYERLTGTPPFRQRSDVEWPEFDYYKQVMEHVPPAPRTLFPAVPEVLSAVAMRLLAKTPVGGYRDAGALQVELERALVAAPASWDAPFPVPRGVQRRDLTRSSPVRLPQPDDFEAARPAPVAPVETKKRPTRLPPEPPLEDASTRKVEPVALFGRTERAIAALGQQSSQGNPPLSVSGFQAPTTEIPPAFVPADVEMPPMEQAGGGVSVDGTLRRVAEQLRTDARPRKRISALGLTMVGAATLVLAALVIKSVAGRAPAPPKSLLERYQEALTLERQTGDTEGRDAQRREPAALPAETSASATMGAAESSAVVPATPSPGSSSGESSPPSPSDAKAIQAELERAYGNKRPSLPARVPSAGTGMPSWVKGVEVVDAKPPAVGDKKLGGRYGDHLRLQLRSNLDSRLCGSGAVEAVLVRPYLVKDTLVLPARTLAYGRCTAQSARFLVSFDRLRLPDGTEARFDGVAMDVADGKPGLAANRRLTNAGALQEGVGSTVARGAASTVLEAATVGAGVGGQVASGAGQTAINARSPVSNSGSEDAILLDAGAGIDVFLRQSF